ncbi:RDD family protein [Mycolicibacterium austroafricanum]|uniref:RDD family protein n=2 Tax=Mycolicibacterium austroafricanum TaxID=39687 RepID=A0ABT8HKK3_MYCAO|nr:RDD family protein [Mycolicibacterium austroafricanum]MDN4521281.1 RDD family protein [Mycolicibacterium austroafricanum]QRZ08168.1 RDD family protein [Mycolicibacterium austroafricanum]
MPGPPASADAICVRCGSRLLSNAAYCNSCGNAVINCVPAVAAPPLSRPATRDVADGGDCVVPAGRALRCCSFLMDLAALLSPALPLAIAAAVLGVAEVVYIVVPVAFVAVWVWMQIWQGFTGITFGKSMLGLRLVRATDRQPPGLTATLKRGGVFVVTGGLAALPVVIHSAPTDGFHDEISGLTVIDVARGSNPIGPRPQIPLRKSVNRSLNRVQSPVPLGPTRYR